MAKEKGVSVTAKVSTGKQVKSQLRQLTMKGLKRKKTVLVIKAKILPEEILVVDGHGRKRGLYRLDAATALQSGGTKKVVGVDPGRFGSAIPHRGLPPANPKRRAMTMAEAEARGAIVADEIMTRQDMLSGEELAVKFRLTRQAIDKRRRAGRILAVTISKRGYKYPKAQFDPTGQVLPGIEKVIEHYKGNGWRAWRFLSKEHTAFGNKTGFNALKDGKIQEVLAQLNAIDHGAFS